MSQLSAVMSQLSAVRTYAINLVPNSSFPFPHLFPQ